MELELVLVQQQKEVCFVKQSYKIELDPTTSSAEIYAPDLTEIAKEAWGSSGEYCVRGSPRYQFKK